MAVVHIVLFRFKPDVPAEKIKEISAHFLSLKSQCLHPTTQQPYPQSLIGGVNNSPEGASNGLTHGFVVEFASEEDRAYYVEKDPAHDEFKKMVGPLLVKGTVVDFVPGVF